MTQPLSDIIINTMNKDTNPQNRLRAIKLYCQGVREDFPQTKTWMDNILTLAGFDPNE